MDKEGQNTDTPVFQSDTIGNRVTPEYFSNVKGGKKDKEKVTEARTKKSRRGLFITLGIIAALLIIVMITALNINFSHRPYGSRTDEEVPADISDIETRAYKVVRSGDEEGYTNALYYLNDLIRDMDDLKLNPDLIFAAYAVRARITFEGGAREVAIEEALRLAKEADTEMQKLYIYHELFYMYNQIGDIEKREFYGDLLRDLDVDLEKDAVGGVADEQAESSSEQSTEDNEEDTKTQENTETTGGGANE